MRLSLPGEEKEEEEREVRYLSSSWRFSSAWSSGMTMCSLCPYDRHRHARAMPVLLVDMA